MTITRYLSEDELIEQAILALFKALGPIEATRFLSLPRQTRLESVKRHHQWQATLNQTEFFYHVFGQ